MISNAISKCEFKTYKGFQEEKSAEYWRWNYKPNKNENSSTFLHKLVSNLYQNNETLVFEHEKQLFVADSYIKNENSIYEDTFSNVMVGNFQFGRTFKRSEVIFYKLNSVDMRVLLNGMNDSYSKMLDSSQKAFEWSNGNHAKLKVDAFKSGAENFSEEFKKQQENYIMPFLTQENGVYPEFDGYELSKYGETTSRTQQNTRDIKALIDDIFEITAKAFNIPAAMLKGNVEGTKDAVSNFLTFCIDPLCDQLQEEINTQIYGYKNFSAGNYIKIDTSTIEHFDWFANAQNIEKLISSGAKSIDEILQMAGEVPHGTDWSEQHYITKNYSAIQDLNELGGGENTEDKQNVGNQTSS